MSMPRREDEAPAPNGLGAKRAKRRCRTGVNNPSCSIVFPMRPYPDVDLIHPSCWLFKPVPCLLGINHEKIYMWASPHKLIEILYIVAVHGVWSFTARGMTCRFTQVGCLLDCRPTIGLAIYSLPAGPIEVKKCNRVLEWTIAKQLASWPNKA